MNLKELDSFKMSDAVTFHDKLNPKLWSGMHLRHEVEKQLQIIAEDFMAELGISGLNVEDITVSGSNAAYSYTPHSDLDLHIIVDMGKLPNDEVYKELFNAKKTLYNDSHDVKVHGVPVELYVQDSREPVKSLGEYSLLRNEWIKFPTKRRANFDQTATKAKFEKLAKVIELALKSKNLDKIQEALKTIKRYRQAGLEKGGEFGPENLAFKAIRSQGLITKLYQLRDELHSEELSIESAHLPTMPLTDEEQLAERFAKEFETFDVTEDETLQFAAEKTPAVNPYGGMKDRQFRGSISENNNTITLKQLYNGNYPDRDELFWDEVRPGELETPLDVKVLPKHMLKIMLTSQYRVEHIDELFDMMDEEQKDHVESYTKDPNLSDKIIVISGDRIIDGNHRALAAAIKNVPIKYVDLVDLEDEDLQESASGYIPSNAEKNDPRFKTALTVRKR